MPKQKPLPDYLIKFASEIETRPVEWLWPGRIPLGKITIIAGPGGLGKSFVCCDLAARISVGGELPDRPGERFQVGKVLVINCEDHPEDTTVPRLKAAGADTSRIGILRSDAIRRFTLKDVDTLERAVGQTGGVSLIVIDPAAAFVGKVNDHRNADLQKLLAPLRVAAWRMGAAVALVTHVVKPKGNNLEAAAQVVGGVAWVNSARSAFIVAADPDDGGRRLLVPFKANNGPRRKGLAYRIRGAGDLARIEWEGETDVSANEAISRGKRRPKGKAKTAARPSGKRRQLSRKEGAGLLGLENSACIRREDL